MRANLVSQRLGLKVLRRLPPHCWFVVITCCANVACVVQPPAASSWSGADAGPSDGSVAAATDRGASCSANTDCPAERFCMQGTCVNPSGACEDHSDCAAGQYCYEQRCTVPGQEAESAGADAMNPEQADAGAADSSSAAAQPDARP